MAAAPAPARRAPARRPAAPRPARRAPARKPAPRRAPALQRRRPRGAAVVDALLHGRGWIALVFVLLAGIVFFNIDLLRMNREIATTAAAAGEMNRDNARLRALTARLGSSERIQEVASRAGLVLPAPGEVRYLRSNPSVDSENAARRLDEGKGDPELAAAPVIPEPVESTPVVAERRAGRAARRGGAGRGAGRARARRPRRHHRPHGRRPRRSRRPGGVAACCCSTAASDCSSPSS